MANVEGGLHPADPRRLALRCIPPGELREGYLDYLDGIELNDPDAAAPAQASPAPSGDLEDQRWSMLRYVVVAMGSVAFAFGTWALTSLL